MAGSCPVNLAVAVADAGGMGAMGALMSSPDAMAKWAAEFRSRSPGPFQLNLCRRAAGARVPVKLGAGGPVSPKRSGGGSRRAEQDPVAGF
jgi:NAD(P)H-dependent flavin oxidoreductase YrpB (nitropropane dioxygenase family)